MKDGFYVTAYTHIHPLMHALNLQNRHDHAFTLWRKEGEHVRIVRQWELERITRQKQHHRSFFNADQAKECLANLLRTENLSLDDIIEIWGTPQLDTTHRLSAVDDHPAYAPHSLYHLFSAILMDSDAFYNGRILGFAIDGIPDELSKRYCYVGCYVDHGKIHLSPACSPGMIWGYAALHFHMREGTLMTLASAGTSRLLHPPKDILLFDMVDPVKDTYQTIYAFIHRMEEQIQSFSDADVGVHFSGFDPHFSRRDNTVSMIMKVIQDMSERIMFHNIDAVLKEFDVDPKETSLAMSGGFALNCPTNSALMKAYGFRSFLAPPCVSDTGISMGMGLYGFHKEMGFLKHSLTHAYLGDEDARELEALTPSYSRFCKTVSEFDMDVLIRDIEREPIVWFYGSSEIGPRALGNRSLIADPRTVKSKDLLNQYKQRQWWRPVAPIVLEEAADAWFENAHPSPFMLHNFIIRKDKEALVPAVVHFDGSARIQTLSIKDNPTLYRVLKAFYKETGVPILCNTSLNDRGEPIIQTIEQAFEFALRKGIPVMYVNGKRIALCCHNEYDQMITKEQDNGNYIINERLKKSPAMYNPHNISNDALSLFYMCNLHEEYDLMDEDSAKRLNTYTKASMLEIGIDSII